MLYKIAVSRNSDVLMAASRQTIETYDQALTWLGNGATKDTPDDMITTIFALRVSLIIVSCWQKAYSDIRSRHSHCLWTCCVRYWLVIRKMFLKCVLGISRWSMDIERLTLKISLLPENARYHDYCNSPSLLRRNCLLHWTPRHAGAPSRVVNRKQNTSLITYTDRWQLSKRRNWSKSSLSHC